MWRLDDLAQDASLVVSELVANAVQHARRDTIRVVIERPGAARLRVCVVDFSQAPPVRKEPGPEEEGGRGLVLIAELAEQWGSEPLPWGKRVWAELHA